MNQNDDKAIFGLMLEWGATGSTDTFRRSVVEYIATIRQEERRAAFKGDVIDALKLLAHPKFTTDDEGRIRYYVTKSDVEFARALIAQIETAETGEDGDDG